MKVKGFNLEIRTCDECGKQGYCVGYKLKHSRYIIFRNREYFICISCLREGLSLLILFKNTMEQGTP
jgi:recombinational DNA repair protein (RecF pathway)